MSILSNRANNAEGILGRVYAGDYGLQANGASDDLGAIRKSINVALALGAGVVELAPGTVPVSGSIPIPSNLELVIPTGCTLKLMDGANADVITNADTVNGNSGIRLTGGGVIDGNKANQTSGGNGINLVNCPDAIVAVAVQNCYDDGIVLTDCARPVLGGTVAISNGVHGVHLEGSSFSVGTIVARDNGQRVAGSGLALDDDGSAVGSTDSTIVLSATDSRSDVNKTQQYGVIEIAGSHCDRNTIIGSCSGNATGTASFVGALSALVGGVALTTQTLDGGSATSVVTAVVDGGTATSVSTNTYDGGTSLG